MTKPIYIPHKASGYAHPKCYLSHTNGCSTKISGEHYISRNLLDKIERQNKTIDVVGLAWLPKGQLTSIGKASLTSNVLCAQHNSDLAPLDSAIGELFEAIGSIDEEYRKAMPVGLIYQVDGAHIERWILKTVLGLVRSGQIKQRSGDPFGLKAECLELLCLPHARWPLGWGLYIVLPAEKLHHSYSFALLPKHNPHTGELLSLGLQFNGIEMNFLMGRPDSAHAFGVHRPSKLVFEKGVTKSEIVFNWQGRKAGPLVTLSHAGTYSGPAPGHNLPRTSQHDT